jgi:cell division protein FtsI (penicillin-binding protein 3)
LDIKKDIRFRVYIAFTGICLFGLAIVLQAAKIQVKEGPDLRKLGQEMYTRTDSLPAERGNIYTEDGQLLCSSIPQFDVHIDFSVISPKLFNEHVDSLSKCLAGLFKDGTAAQYRQMLQHEYDKGSRYYLLRRNLAYYDYQAVRSFPIFNKGKAYGGFIEDPREKRINPYGMLAYRTIGLWRENSQAVGLENRYDSLLKGTDGIQVAQRATGNVWVPVEGSEVDPQNGKDIVTTIDVSVQDVAEHALMSVLQKYECKYGTVVVMEVQTGKIRALVNLGRQDDGSYWEDLNYALMPTEPGSTFKAATLLSLLNDRYVTVNDIVDAEGGAIRFGNRVMKDAEGGLHAIPIWKAYAESSNAAMAKLAYTYYYKQPEKFVAHLHKLHLDRRTGIDIAGERSPTVKSPKNKSWSATTLPWMATGYEVLITPLHTCMLYNAVANGGRMMKPYLVSAIREYGKDVKTIEPTVLEEHIGDSSTIAQMRRCMDSVVTMGTAHSIRSPYYAIAGKTGTAQVADKGFGYSAGIYQGSFVGFFPAGHPKYTIAVVIRTKPHSSAYYGGAIAAPVFRMIADRIFANSKGAWSGPLDSLARNAQNKVQGAVATAWSYDVLLKDLGIKTSDAVPGEEMTSVNTDSSHNVVMRPKQVYRGYVPDVTGMGLKDAVYLLESQGMQVQLNGKGRVLSQSVPPGTRINKGQNITLQLS